MSKHRIAFIVEDKLLANVSRALHPIKYLVEEFVMEPIKGKVPTDDDDLLDDGDDLLDEPKPRRRRVVNDGLSLMPYDAIRRTIEDRETTTRAILNEVGETVGFSASTVQNVLTKLIKEGLVVRAGKGVYSWKETQVKPAKKRAKRGAGPARAKKKVAKKAKKKAGRGRG